MYEILPVNKELFQEFILDEQHKTYSVITKFLFKELIELGPTVFRKWLAKELDIPEQWINVSSLNSALARFRKANDKGTILQEKNEQKN